MQDAHAFVRCALQPPQAAKLISAGACSLPIHVPQCQQKFVRAQELKPAAERRALPPEPEALSQPLPTSASGIDAFNAAMFAFYNGVSLYQCTGCGRSFHSEAFEKHRKRCDGGGGRPVAALPASGAPGGAHCMWHTRTYCPSNCRQRAASGDRSTWL